MFVRPASGEIVLLSNHVQISIIIDCLYFRQYNTLYIHKTIHSNERKYKCKECGKTFRQNAHLKTHLKTHGIGIDTWHVCTICDKRFYSRGNLTVHMWVHKAGHPFQCSECGKGYARKNKMEAHIKKEHTFK